MNIFLIYYIGLTSMKQIITIILIIALFLSVANANTEVKMSIAGDVYYVTDSDSWRRLVPRRFGTTNIYKDRIGTNNVLLEANVSNDFLKANFGVGHFGDGSIVPEIGNISLKLFDEL